MKTLLALFLCAATAAFAQTDPVAKFPGIKVVMTPEEYIRAGLSNLTPDQLGVIDAAIIRHYVSTVEHVANLQAAQITQQNIADEHKRGWLTHFGMPDLSMMTDWRNQPSLKAHCKGWVGGNSFELDNGQVWEGLETLTTEVADRDVELQPRPDGAFALIVNGKNTTLRVHRIK